MGRHGGRPSLIAREDRVRSPSGPNPGLKARLRKATRLSSPKSYVAAGFLASPTTTCGRAIASATAAWAI